MRKDRDKDLTSLIQKESLDKVCVVVAVVTATTHFYGQKVSLVEAFNRTILCYEQQCVSLFHDTLCMFRFYFSTVLHILRTKYSCSRNLLTAGDKANALVVD